MAKLTFAAKTFAARTFASGTWAGAGAPVVAPTLVCHLRPAELSIYGEGDDPTTWDPAAGTSIGATSVNTGGSIAVRKAGINGHDYVEIAGDSLDLGTDHLVLDSELGATGNRTVFMVMRLGDIIARAWPHNCETFVDFADPALDEHYINFNPNGSEVDFVCGRTSFPGTPLTATKNSVKASVVNRWHIVILVHDGDNLESYLTSLTPAATATVSSFTPGDIENGSPAQIGYTSIVDVAELRVYDAALTGSTTPTLAEIYNELLDTYFQGDGIRFVVPQRGGTTFETRKRDQTFTLLGRGTQFDVRKRNI